MREDLFKDVFIAPSCKSECRNCHHSAHFMKFIVDDKEFYFACFHPEANCMNELFNRLERTDGCNCKNPEPLDNLDYLEYKHWLVTNNYKTK